jgi:hypothetical protein
MLALFVCLGFVLLMCIGLWVARRYGPTAAYVGLAWLIPLMAIIWTKWENELGFGFSSVNVWFGTIIILASALLSVFCFPLLIDANKGRLTVLKVVGLFIAALLHGLPFLLVLIMYVSFLMWGK